MSEVVLTFDQLLQPVIERGILPHDAVNEKDFGIFPAPAELTNGNGPVEVTVDRATVVKLNEDYESKDLSIQALTALYVQTGIIQAVLRSYFDPRDTEKVTEVYSGLSSPDNLCRQIFDHDKLDDNQERMLLMSLQDGSITTDTAGINASRLAVTIAYSNSILPVEILPDETNLQSSMITHLKETLGRNHIYAALFTACGGTLEHATSQFANTIPQLEVIGAFPMPLAEAEHIVELINAS